MPLGGCCSCQEIEKMIEEKLQLFLSRGPAAKGGPRKKRAPSAYNLFIGQCMKQGKGMKQCSTEWKQQKQSQ